MSIRTLNDATFDALDKDALLEYLHQMEQQAMVVALNTKHDKAVQIYAQAAAFNRIFHTILSGEFDFVPEDATFN